MTTTTSQAPAPELFTDSAESTNATFTALYNLVRPSIKSYVDDLIKHDRRTIEREKPGTPFIYGYRQTGTGLVMLYPDMETYEEAGIKVGQKYIFDTIRDERHKYEIMRELKVWVTTPAMNNKYLYFDGKKFHHKTREQVNDIHDDHINQVIAEHKRKQEQLRTQYNTAA